MSSNLDPKDWSAFENAAFFALKNGINQIRNADQYPWKDLPPDVSTKYKLIDDDNGTLRENTSKNIQELVELLVDDVLPYHTGNIHPRFWGWVHGTGLADNLIAEIISACMNSNLGGRNHAAIYLERAVVEWAIKLLGFPNSSSGILVTGTSQATILALAAARVRTLGPSIRQKGHFHFKTQLVSYASEASHGCVKKALELLGIGSDSLRRISCDTNGSMDILNLEERIKEDLNLGNKPLAVIGTAGSVDGGSYDNFTAIAKLCKKYGIWFHVDGAFGGWIKLASSPWCDLGDGLELADSLACDFHKWVYVNYDCGLVIFRDSGNHLATFQSPAKYLATSPNGLAAGAPWFCDLGSDLSRGNRALKVWSSLKLHGSKEIGLAITRNCILTHFLAQELLDKIPSCAILNPVISNVCVFTLNATILPGQQSALNNSAVQKLQSEQVAVFSTTTVSDVVAIRAALVNHRSTYSDVSVSVKALQVFLSCYNSTLLFNGD